MKKKIAILQSNYIPWKGYFDLINSVDEFVIYDTVQFTKNDWRNRNLIKTNNGLLWLTVPVTKGKMGKSIRETRVANNLWAKKHWKTIGQYYSKAKYYRDYKEIFKSLYLSQAGALSYLSDINFLFIKEICGLLKIKTKLTWSDNFNLVGEKTERLLFLCKAANATSYVSGPSAKNYLDVRLLNENGISVEWMDYSGYQEYQQLHGCFEHGISILDLIFNEGSNATKKMKSFK